MKCLAALLILVAVGVESQNRPFYAPRPHQYPTLISRFGEAEGDLNNRVGEGESSSRPNPVLIGGSVVDQELINRVASWPRDKQPFWFVNNQAIQNHLQNPPNLNLPPPQSPFAAGGRL